MRSEIDVILVTGFLGTGKTSLIRAFLAEGDHSRTGIIVNEAGDTGFDGIQIAEATGDTSSIRMLGNGCLCCEGADDLAQSIRDLVDRHIATIGVPSERIIVEASGLARPGRLLRQFAEVREFDLRVHVVATVDATLTAAPDRHDEIAAQWAAAACLVLTRADLADDHGAAALAMAAAINPLAACFAGGETGPRGLAAFAPSATQPAVLPPIPAHAHGRVRAMTLAQRPDADWDACAEWLDNLAGIGDDRVLRVKGVISPPDTGHSWLVQAVGTTFALPAPTARQSDGHLVVIGEDITPAWLAALEPVGAFFLPLHEAAS